jgi:uncharacterized protein
MEWRQSRRSTNIEDRRGMRIPGGIGGLELGGVLLVALIALLSGNPGAVLDMFTGGGGSSVVASEPGRALQPGDEQADFVSAVLASTEDVWTEQFQRSGRSYSPPTLVLFTDEVRSACGHASAASGPFYCPDDRKVFLDLSFFDELRTRLGAPGDFAQAYVIAHEVGHHVQNLMGTMEQVQSARAGITESEANALSVRLELQADFLAGVWAHYARSEQRILEVGDVEEALNAASAIGDDRLQRSSRGRVVPDSFTHGTAAQRVRWFKRGFESGKVSDGDTFSAREL